MLTPLLCFAPAAAVQAGRCSSSGSSTASSFLAGGRSAVDAARPATAVQLPCTRRAVSTAVVAAAGEAAPGAPASHVAALFHRV